MGNGSKVWCRQRGTGQGNDMVWVYFFVGTMRRRTGQDDEEDKRY
tara:strand:- start:563 stop:697 length:135 start_codon:yes stop_codon:yes gene_type:complete